MQTVDITI